MSKAILLQGNEACVMGAIKAGMRLFAGYPITPSSEIAEQSSILLPKVGGKFLQMEDDRIHSGRLRRKPGRQKGNDCHQRPGLLP